MFKVLLRESGEDGALQGMAAMQRVRVVDLTASLAASAARLSLKLSLPMADSIILATAKASDATLWTQDADFADLAGPRSERY